MQRVSCAFLMASAFPAVTSQLRRKGKDRNVTGDQQGISSHRCLIALKIHKAQQDILTSQRPLQPTISAYVLWILRGTTLNHRERLNISNYRTHPCSLGKWLTSVKSLWIAHNKQKYETLTWVKGCGDERTLDEMSNVFRLQSPPALK